jgi:hypothetical protein
MNNIDYKVVLRTNRIALVNNKTFWWFIKGREREGERMLFDLKFCVMNKILLLFDKAKSKCIYNNFVTLFYLIIVYIHICLLK